jgi:hypothetical protein
MARPRPRTASALVIGATLGLFLLPGTAFSQLVVPATCTDVRARFPLAPDGQYVIFAKGDMPVVVYCHDMASNPREYITLRQTAPGANFSQYTAGGASPGTNVRTSFTRLRFDPKLLVVDIGDLTFTESVGSLTHEGQKVTSMPYGAAMSCNSATDGLGNVDLRGTPFAVANPFAVGGFNANGSATLTSGDQVVELKGRGFCGWITPWPVMYNPFNPSVGDFHLQLKCIGPLGGTAACLSAP